MPRTSVACAREMQRRFAELNQAWRNAGKPTAGMRIGLYSGAMVGCNIGSRQRLEYTVIGDAVNMAARLQALALPDGDEGERGRILIGDTTRALRARRILRAQGTRRGDERVSYSGILT